VRRAALERRSKQTWPQARTPATDAANEFHTKSDVQHEAILKAKLLDLIPKHSTGTSG